VLTCLRQVSKAGRQGIITERTDSWQKLRGTVGRSGYIQVSVHGRIMRLNRLIAMNFLPNPMAYPESQHKNGIRTDNRVVNLKWGNQQHNAADRHAHGNTAIGARNPNAKLDDQKVRKILAGRKNGQTLQSLADENGVSKKLILLLTQNKIWKHVKR
jgi:hypothetical protein